MPTYTVGEQLLSPLIRTCLYGIGSGGKTSHATRLPEEWGNGIYIAADSTSPRMKSILPEDRARMICVTPDGYTRRAGDDSSFDGENKDEILSMDWKGEAYDLAQRNWPRWLKDNGFEEFAQGMTPGFVIWDGMSGTGDNLLSENARKNYFSEKGATSGPRHADLDPAKKFKVPQQGDFLMVQSECLEIIEWNNMQPHHVITCFQEAIQQADAGAFRDTLFGPCTVGRAGPRQVPNRFDAIFYMSREVNELNPEGKIRVQMRQADYHVSAIKTSDMNAEIPTYRLMEKEPQDTREFWRWLEKLGSSVQAVEEVTNVS